MKGGRRCAALVVVALAHAGCSGGPLPAPDVVAEVEGRSLPYAQFGLYLKANSVASESGLSSEILSRLFDQFLDEELLATLAVERSFGPPPAASRAEVRAMIEAELPEAIDEEAVQGYYRAHQSDFVQEERVLLRQLLVGEREAAEEALAALAAGAGFDEIVARYSQGPGAERGGFQGELTRADLPPHFAEVIFALDEGEISEIVPADYGFHVFQVVQRHPAGTLEPAAIREEIERRVRRELRAEARSRLVDEARTRYNVEAHERNLPFNYEGRY